jgi:hypothetical protein
VPEPAATAPETLDKVEHPHEHFELPVDVVVDPALSRDEKAQALDGLEQDARQLAAAAAEGMADGGGGDLHDVLEAKQALEQPPVDLATTVVLQNLRARLAAADGDDTSTTLTRTTLTRAIGALEAAGTGNRSPDNDG